MKFILGTKQGMTQIFREDGAVVPVTKVQAGPCVVTQVKTAKRDGVDAVQLGFGEQKAFRLNKAAQGHLKGLSTVRFMRDITTGEDHAGLKRGDQFTVSVFEPGDKVQVIGTSKGKGFQGVVKRHGFKGASASHGTKDQERMPGSIGPTGPARVFKGVRMAGQMGGDRVTVKNLEIVKVNADENELFIKGALPGARGGLIVISTEEGVMDISTPEPEVTEEVPTEETAPEATDEKKEDTPASEEKPVADASEEQTEDAPTEEKNEESNKTEDAPAEEKAEEASADEESK